MPQYAHVIARTTVFPFGPKVFMDESKQVCASGILNPPEGDDSGYKCPSAGVYNFKTSVRLPGDDYSWFGDLYGFNTGIVLTIRDVSNSDQIYVRCTATIMVHKGIEKYRRTGTYVFGASLGMVGLVFYGCMRRRRILAQQSSSTTSPDEEAVQFEMMVDPPMSSSPEPQAAVC